MIADLKPTSAMKDSGVPWLGEVPEHWEILPLARLLKERKEKNDPIKTTNILSLSLETGVIPYADKKPGGNKAKEDLSAYMLAYPGDIVLNSMNVVVGSVGLSKYFGAVSPVYYMLRPRSSNDLVEYFNAIFHDVVFQRSLFGLGNGILYIESKSSGKLNTIRLRIPMSKLKRVLLPYPSPKEQAAIVRFLDHANRRIRRYIRTKQKLIKLLEEQKQTIIHRAVTRGLDPNVRLKPSGVEWLGDVPEHWEVLPIKRVFVSMDYGISESATDAGTIRILTMGNIKDGRVTVPESGGVPTVDHSLLLIPGDLLFNRTNSAELVGKVGLYRGADPSVTFASYLVRMRPRAEHEPEYLNMLLNDVSILSIARREAIPSLHQSNLNPTRYGRLQISVPPVAEQREILGLLKESSFDLDRTLASTHREISLLREYRVRLIADVVTGKLDVREAAARLPDEVGELDYDEGAAVTDVEADAADELDAIPEEAES